MPFLAAAVIVVACLLPVGDGRLRRTCSSSACFAGQLRPADFGTLILLLSRDGVTKIGDGPAGEGELRAGGAGGGGSKHAVSDEQAAPDFALLYIVEFIL